MKKTYIAPSCHEMLLDAEDIMCMSSYSATALPAKSTSLPTFGKNGNEERSSEVRSKMSEV